MKSSPKEGKFEVIGFYIDPDTEELVIQTNREGHYEYKIKLDIQQTVDKVKLDVAAIKP